MTQPDGNAELERQRADLEAVFDGPRVAPDAGQPRVLAVFTYAESLRVINRGGSTSLDRATIDAVRGGAQPVIRWSPSPTSAASRMSKCLLPEAVRIAGRRSCFLTGISPVFVSVTSSRWMIQASR